MASGASRPKVENRKRKPAVAEDPRPELVDATHYDFGRLEVVVTELVERQRLLQGENAELREQLQARDERTRALESEVENLQKRRSRTHQRLDGVIEELSRLEATVGNVASSESTKAASPSGTRGKKGRSGH
jgi:chromosome segregation ATPase